MTRNLLGPWDKACSEAEIRQEPPTTESLLGVGVGVGIVVADLALLGDVHRDSVLRHDARAPHFRVQQTVDRGWTWQSKPLCQPACGQLHKV